MKTIYSIPVVEFLPIHAIRDERTVTVVTTVSAWEQVKTRLQLEIAEVIEIVDATENEWRKLITRVNGDVVYSIGGGLAVDCAKYLANLAKKRLICIPTALSVDAFFTWASGVRSKGCVHYLPTQSPEKVLIDLKIVKKSPKEIRSAAVCDVLSIATGLWDWKYSQEKGLNPRGMEYDKGIAEIAQSILSTMLDSAPQTGKATEDGLKRLLDCLAMEVQLCNQIGHARPEEGSEHYFAYSVENLMGKGLPHGDLVGPGILLMALAQGIDANHLFRALKLCHIPLNNIPDEVMIKTLKGLPGYCRKHSLPYGIAHELTSTLIKDIMNQFRQLVA